MFFYFALRLLSSHSFPVSVILLENIWSATKELCDQSALLRGPTLVIFVTNFLKRPVINLLFIAFTCRSELIVCVNYTNITNVLDCVHYVTCFPCRPIRRFGN